MRRIFTLPGNVLILGLVSLLTDISSGMVYPLLPLFLATTLSLLLCTVPPAAGSGAAAAEQNCRIRRYASSIRWIAW